MVQRCIGKGGGEGGGVWEMIFKKSMCKCLGKKIVENGGLNTRARDMRK